MGWDWTITSHYKSDLSNKIRTMYDCYKFNQYADDCIDKIRNIESSGIFI